MSNASEKSLMKLRSLIEEENNIREYIRPKEGWTIYGLKRTTFQRLAMKAGAVYKVGTVVLINKRIFDEYLDSHKMGQVVDVGQAQTV